VILVLKSEKTNTKGIINLGWFSRSIFPKFDFRVTLHGTVDFDSTDRYVPNLYTNAVKEGFKNISRKVIRRPIQPLSYTYYYHSYYKEIENFYDSIIQDTNPLVTPEDSLKTMEIIQNSYDTYYSGKNTKIARRNRLLSWETASYATDFNGDRGQNSSVNFWR